MGELQVSLFRRGLTCSGGAHYHGVWTCPIWCWVSLGCVVLAMKFLFVSCGLILFACYAFVWIKSGWKPVAMGLGLSIVIPPFVMFLVFVSIIAVDWFQGDCSGYGERGGNCTLNYIINDRALGFVTAVGRK